MSHCCSRMTDHCDVINPPIDFAPLPRHALLYVDNLFIVCNTFDEATRVSSQHWKRSPAGPREEMIRVEAPSTRSALRSRQKSPGRLRISASICGCLHFMSVICSLMCFHLREIFNTQDQYKPKSFLSQVVVDNLFFWRNFSIKSPENLQELWSDHTSTALYTTASGTTGCGSELQPTHETTRSSTGWWSAQEVLEMIVLKEVKVCRHDLHHQNVEALTDRKVKFYQDDMTVVGSLHKMSSKYPDLMRSGESWNLCTLQRLQDALHSACKRRNLCRPVNPMSTRPSSRTLFEWTAAGTTCRDPVGAMEHPPSLLHFECRPRRGGSCILGAKVQGP